MTQGLTQVIDSQVHLKAIGGLGVGAHHHPCIVNEDVELLLFYKKWIESTKASEEMLA